MKAPDDLEGRAKRIETVTAELISVVIGHSRDRAEALAAIQAAQAVVSAFPTLR